MTNDECLPQAEQLELHRGEFVLRCDSWSTQTGLTAVVGLNGAGKTTLLRVLQGDLSPDQGKVLPAGAACYLPQGADASLPVTVAQFLRYVAFVRSVPNAEREPAVRESLQRFGLDEVANRPLKKLSGGWRRRAVLAACSVAPADCFLLDEPTVSLDIAAARSAWQTIRQLSQLAPAVVATHDASAVLEFADRVVVIRNGLVSTAREAVELREQMARSQASAEAFLLDEFKT